MSPFSSFLRQLRASRGVRQGELASLLGYEPSYLSSLENGAKGPPRQDFIDRLVKGLALSEAEQEKLNIALAASQRRMLIPLEASQEEYFLCRQFEAKLGKLKPLQIQLINIALQMDVAGCCSSGHLQQ